MDPVAPRKPARDEVIERMTYRAFALEFCPGAPIRAGETLAQAGDALIAAAERIAASA